MDGTIKLYSRYMYMDIGSHKNTRVGMAASYVPEHTYLIWENEAGDKRIIRGGPQDPATGLRTEQLHVYEAPYVFGHPDFPLGISGDDRAPADIATGTDEELEAIWELMKDRADTITDGEHEYAAFDENCNASAFDILDYVDGELDGPEKLLWVGRARWSR